MGSQRPSRIGFLFDEFYEDYVVEAWHGGLEGARRRGVKFIAFGGGKLRDSGGAGWLRNDLFGLIDPGHIDGLVVLTSSLANFVGSGSILDFCARFAPLPILHIGTPGPALHSVRVDGYAGMRELLDHLVEHHGRTRIAFIKGPEGLPDADERFEAYRDALEAHGLAFVPELVYPGDFYRETGAAAAEDFLARGVAFDALVGANDYMATFAMARLKERGVRVPEEVSVAGFDDLHAARSSDPPLTTVAQPVFEMCAKAVEKMVDWVEAGIAPAEEVFRSRPVIRRSCGCQPDSRQDPLLASAITPAEVAAFRGQLAGLVAGGEGSDFLRWLDEACAAAAARGVPTIAWIDEVARSFAGAVPGARALEGVLSPSIYRYLFLLQEERAQREHHAIEEAEGILQQLAGSLVGLADKEQIPGVLERVLAAAGIGFFCGVEYAGAGEGRVFYCSAGSPAGLRFPTKFITPSGAAGREEPHSLIAIPLYFGSEGIGYFACEAPPGKERVLELLREHLSGALFAARLHERERAHAAELEARVEARTRELERALAELRGANARLETISTIDELTGVLNRRGFMAQARRMVELAARRKLDFLLLFLDLDGLKRINDGHGHEEGDWAIRETAALLREAFRQTDIIGRYGGDEFVILAIDCTLERLATVLERLDASTARLNASSGKPFRVAFSQGAAPSDPARPAKLEELLAEADANLYAAKKARGAGRGPSEAPDTPGSGPVRR